MRRTVEDEIRQAKQRILDEICEPARVLGVVYTNPSISDTAASLCIEDDAGCEEVAEALRQDGWQVLMADLYGRPGIVVC